MNEINSSQKKKYRCQEVLAKVFTIFNQQETKVKTDFRFHLFLV